MMEKQFKVTNISPNGMTGLFWLGKDNLSVYDVTKLLNDLIEENEQLISALKELKEIGDYQADRIQELDDENKQLEQQNKNLFEKLKFTAEQVNYSENLRKMLNGGVE